MACCTQMHPNPRFFNFTAGKLGECGKGGGLDLRERGAGEGSIVEYQRKGRVPLKMCVLQTQFFISCEITGVVKVQKRYCNKIVKKEWVGGKNIIKNQQQQNHNRN